MELTKKDYLILEFISKYKYVKEEHLKAFVKDNQIKKRLQRLVWQRKIIIKDEIISIFSNEELQLYYKENLLKILDVVTFLKKQNRILDIDIIDQPFYIMARSAKKDVYMYFTIVNKSDEMIQLALIDRENRSNTILILEDKTQVESLKILKNKVNKVIIYDDFLKTNQI